MISFAIRLFATICCKIFHKRFYNDYDNAFYDVFFCLSFLFTSLRLTTS